MNNLMKWGTALASCALISFWSLPIASGSEATASGPGGAAITAPAITAPAITAPAITAPAIAAPAQLLAASASPSGFALTISPTRIAIGAADIGVTQKIIVSNGGDSSESITVEKENFTGAADGALNFQATAPYSASDWVTVTPTSFILGPGTSQTVTASVSVPPSPEPGDHQVALVFLVPAGKSSGNIKINRGIATPVYITVAGPTSDTARLSDLKASGFAIGGPVTITAKVSNMGTVHRDFRGATPLQIRAPGSAAQFPDFTVMRDSTRDISTTWNPPLFCICHPKVSVVNAGGVVSSMTIQVIVVPVPLIGAILGAALLLVAALWLSRRRYRLSVQKAAAAMNWSVSRGDV